MGAIWEVLVYPKLVFKVFPLVQREINKWQGAASQIPDFELRKQALSSIRLKKFHCVGGSVFGLFNPGNTIQVVKAIVAIQTISDYLDNLCDRVVLTESNHQKLYETFMELHEAMMCAVEPGRPMADFYRNYPLGREARDGGYLAQLVHTSRKTLNSLKNYNVVMPVVSRLCRLYCELQATKHLPPAIREDRMKNWWKQRWLKEQDTLNVPCAGISLKWWEFGAACGSTLGMFCMMAYASLDSAHRETADSLYHKYFPVITGLHILLDYFIDMEEDKISRDLNFVSFYGSSSSATKAISGFARQP